MKFIVYEQTPLLRDTLTGLLSQEYPKAEIVVDKGDLEVEPPTINIGEKLVIISGFSNNFHILKQKKSWAYREEDVIFVILAEQIHFMSFVIHEMISQDIRHAITKEECDRSHFLECIDCALYGRVFISPYIQSLISEHRRILRENSSLISLLTEREQEYLKLFCETLSPSHIAEEMNISKNTVGRHKENILLKLQLESVRQLYIAAYRTLLHGISFPKALSEKIMPPDSSKKIFTKQHFAC